MAIEDVIEPATDEDAVLEVMARTGGVDPRILAGSLIAVIDVLKVLLSDPEAMPMRLQIIRQHGDNSQSVSSSSGKRGGEHETDLVAIGKALTTLELVKDLPEFKVLLTKSK